MTSIESNLTQPRSENRAACLLTCLIMLTVAFIQCYRITRGLQWPYDGDFERDMGFIQGMLDGNPGKDPNYLGQFLWYNPLLFYIETIIVRISGWPIHQVVSQAGIFINLPGPLTFLLMAIRLQGFRTASASFLSYLFLATGNIVGSAAATYSPWPYPVCFSQFGFYLTLFVCYQAFSTQKYYWFALLGIACGICFLGHAGPAVLVVLILIYMQGEKMVAALKTKNYASLRTFLLQGGICFVFFVVTSFPLLYVVVWKYHLHFVNRAIFEYRAGILIWHNYAAFLRANVNIQFVIAVIGFVWFYRRFHQTLARKIIFSWFFAALFMFVYTTMLPTIHEKLHIKLPDTVPSYHYFFYIKAAQSIYFGFGLVFMLRLIYQWLSNLLLRDQHRLRVPVSLEYFILLSVLLYAIGYFPIYHMRKDFIMNRDLDYIRGSEKEKIDVYHYILENIPEDKVILCDEEANDFPVMASGRKMVSASYLFSNPYVDFWKRYNDRNDMLSFVKTGQPLSAKKLFSDYQVGYVLLFNTDSASRGPNQPGWPLLFKNDHYRVYKSER